MTELDAVHCPVTLSRKQAGTIVRFIRLLHHLHRLPRYLDLVTPLLSESARFEPGHEAVMMGYDFHITPDGPRLIEVNTNAGGSLLAWRAQQHANGHPFPLHGRRNRIMDSFNEEMVLFSRGHKQKPEHVIILDETPERQFLYHEMQTFAALFAQSGIRASVTAPETLEVQDGFLFHQGQRVDMIYNRHCDFYLDSSAMAPVRAAWLAGRVCLSPNPRTYGLLSDKRRMTLWSDPQVVASLGLSPAQQRLLLDIVLQTRLMAGEDPALLWRERQHWVFKPVSSHGGKGVLLGRKISRARFDALVPGETLVQRLAPPSLTRCTDREQPVKTDFRFFVYRHRVLGIAARVYQGQLTTLREPGSGYAPVRLV
ncbi:MAG: hypothetical protein HQL84_13185 [Magnetococcales bacterium]|nr:hypothetical protein [Magnetococcales bacterium]MBF0150987.1 hypothetical protein [Magnetococcales bacterium]